MNPDEFIGIAIEVASRNGIGGLDADQRLVYLISETEVLCDMEGIDAFLGRYFPKWMEETSAAFAEVGATLIAVALRAITADTISDDLLRDRANNLISGRAGYNYEAIRQTVERRLAKRSP